MNNSVIKIKSRSRFFPLGNKRSVAVGCHGTCDGSWQLPSSGILPHGKHRGVHIRDVPDEYIHFMAKSGAEWAVTELIRRSS